MLQKEATSLHDVLRGVGNKGLIYFSAGKWGAGVSRSEPFQLSAANAPFSTNTWPPTLTRRPEVTLYRL